MKDKGIALLNDRLVKAAIKDLVKQMDGGTQGIVDGEFRVGHRTYSWSILVRRVTRTRNYAATIWIDSTRGGRQ